MKRFLCSWCVHFHRKEFKEGEKVFCTCDAFPKGIPIDILRDESLHRMRNYEGDGGKMFIARKDILHYFRVGELSPEEIEK